jgi:beta-lactamase class C
MRCGFFKRLLISTLVSSCFIASSTYGESNDKRKELSGVMDSVIRPLMQEYRIPGMAVAVIVNGKSYSYNYGVASLKTRQPVTDKTLFEIGSASKTFTATLASYAQVKGNLALSDSASKHLPSLRGSHFDNVSLLNLGTHTAGGLP